MSKTDKKNQHYIPKFYLRNFSYKGNGKQIGIFILKNQFYYKNTKLKTQGSKNFFYGTDGVLEDKLSEVEGVLATGIKNSIENKWTPTKESEEHIDLLIFVALTHLRNPVAINNSINNMELLREKLLEIHPDTDVDKMAPKISHEEALDQSMASLGYTIENMLDLEYKLLINKTSTPFIASDFPVVKLNQFLESRNWKHGKTGYGNMGLQIYIPINDTTAYFLYDPAIYKVGFKKNNYLNLTENSDIDKLNMAQILNCHETIFFNERISKHYIEMLYSNSVGFQKANTETIGVHGLVESERNEKSNLLILGNTDVEIKLQINGIKILPNAKFIKLGSKVAQLRTRPSQLMDEKYAKAEQ